MTLTLCRGIHQALHPRYDKTKQTGLSRDVYGDLFSQITWQVTN